MRRGEKEGENERRENRDKRERESGRESGTESGTESGRERVVLYPDGTVCSARLPNGPTKKKPFLHWG